MPTRNVVLTPHHESVIDTPVGSGRYQNASEVLREGLPVAEAREAAKLKALQAAAAVGFGDLDEGRYGDLPDDELEAFIAALRGRASAEAVSL